MSTGLNGKGGETRPKCKHQWYQIDKEYYITEDGGVAKKLIDECALCHKRRER